MNHRGTECKIAIHPLTQIVVGCLLVNNIVLLLRRVPQTSRERKKAVYSCLMPKGHN